MLSKSLHGTKLVEKHASHRTCYAARKKSRLFCPGEGSSFPSGEFFGLRRDCSEFFQSFREIFQFFLRNIRSCGGTFLYGKYPGVYLIQFYWIFMKAHFVLIFQLYSLVPTWMPVSNFSRGHVGDYNHSLFSKNYAERSKKKLPQRNCRADPKRELPLVVMTTSWWYLHWNVIVFTSNTVRQQICIEKIIWI